MSVFNKKNISTDENGCHIRRVKHKNPLGSNKGGYKGEHCIPGIMAHLLQEISTLGKDLNFARRREVQPQNFDFMVGLFFLGFFTKMCRKGFRIGFFRLDLPNLCLSIAI